MANFSMPWVDADFRRKTRALTRIERDAYKNLLQYCFDCEGEMPDSDKRLAQACDLDVRTFRKHKSVLMGFFYRTADGWRNQRIDDDLAKIASLKEQRSLAGQKGGLKTAMKWHRLQRN